MSRRLLTRGNTEMTIQEVAALRTIAGIILDTVREADEQNPNVGTPGGHLYAALTPSGCTLGQFQQIMAGLVMAGKLRQSGDCYHFIRGL